MKPELYPGFSNLEVIVGFAKVMGQKVDGSVWIEELVEVKKWSEEERRLSLTVKSEGRLFGVGGTCGVHAFLFVFRVFKKCFLHY